MNAENQPIDYERVLADLLARRQALDTLILGVAQLVGSDILAKFDLPGATTPKTSSPNRNISSTGAINSDAFFGMSIGDAAKKFLGMMKQPQSLKNIGDSLNAGGLTHSSTNFSATLHTTLSRREKAIGDVVKVKRKWGLKEWYPGLKTKRQDEQRSESEGKN